MSANELIDAKPALFVLVLNDMRSARIEHETDVVRACTAQALVDLLEREKVPPYRDGEWYKVHRAGGPLEWYNAPGAFVSGETTDVFGYGIREVHDVDTFVRRASESARAHWVARFGNLPIID